MDEVGRVVVRGDAVACLAPMNWERMPGCVFPGRSNYLCQGNRSSVEE